ncbi:hemolysin secretion transport system membrane protein [Candidatus Vecturithrix granuli]|uniref:Hemolysin secretion transport system membrane protein n=1 Tax=Vecturithrix granuli TaxID=1499967 RepID=A0A081C7J0_VECG1|nr:hemolysin secretion transport system membrane protein [Candidatus Vecturithrix granuli]
MPEQQLSTQHQEIELRSEEVQEILGQMPSWIVRWGITVILLTLAVILVGSWWFQYPDILSSSIVVTTTQPPAPIVARSNGKLDKLFVKDQQQVTRGEVLAYIENAALYEDVVSLKNTLDPLREHLFSYDISQIPEFREDMTLGTLQASYAKFLTCEKDFRHFSILQAHQKKIASLEQQIQHSHAFHEHLARQKALLQTNLEISQRQYERYQHLKDQALISQKDLDTLHSSVLEDAYELGAAESDLDELTIQIADLETSKLDLTLQYEQQRRQLQLGLQEAYDDLWGQLVSWEHANLLKSPISGTVTFTEYWSENQNVKTGDVVMTIVPSESNQILGKVRLPFQGAGKVKPGQRVQIKFSSYPYQEFGMVAGIVERISLVPADTYYVVEVGFPDGFITNYGNTLPFTQEMQGTAEIITENRRLLERFLQPIQALLAQNQRKEMIRATSSE